MIERRRIIWVFLERQELNVGEPKPRGPNAALRGKSHMPRNSFFFDRIVPILLVVMAIILVGLMLFAAGVLVGLVRF
jgi:hypothetical protein